MKTCNSGFQCEYKTTNTAGSGCNYEGQCSYQTPTSFAAPDTYKVSYNTLSDTLLQQILEELKTINKELKET